MIFSYDLWWEKMGDELKSAYDIATDKSFWPITSAHLSAASPFMLATHNRNLDKDCRDIPVLKHAAKTTDPVESTFATYDYVLRLRAGHGATAGVAQSIRMHAMDTPGALKRKAMDKVNQKRKLGVGTTAPEAENVAEQMAKWTTTSFFALPREERWAIIKSVRKQYKANAKEELLQLQKMDEAKAARQKKAQEDNINKHRNQALKFKEFASIAVITSVAELDSLVAAHAGSPGELAEALRVQIRVRKHVYRVPMNNLPPITAKPGHSAEEEAERLRLAFVELVKVPLPSKQHAPTPFPVRGAIAAPSAEAVKLERDHIKKVSNAWGQLIEVLDGNAVFKAKASKAKRAVAQGAALPPQGKKARTQKPKAAKTPSPSERAVEGAEFEEDGIDWKVLTVRWCGSTEAVVVWYYDVVEAAAGGIDEEQMIDAIDKGEFFDCLEYSSVSEIKRWIECSGKN